MKAVFPLEIWHQVKENVESPWSMKGPSHPEEEGRLINISLSYEVFPLYMGPAESCINMS